MSAAWSLLCDLGVPWGALRAAPSLGARGGQLDEGKLRAAVVALHDARFAGLGAAERECLYAWLRAFRHHWPARFELILAGVGERALAELRDRDADPGRYLKLRRIAVENLAALL